MNTLFNATRVPGNSGNCKRTWRQQTPEDKHSHSLKQLWTLAEVTQTVRMKQLDETGTCNKDLRACSHTNVEWRRSRSLSPGSLATLGFAATCCGACRAVIRLTKLRSAVTGCRGGEGQEYEAARYIVKVSARLQRGLRFGTLAFIFAGQLCL